MSDEMKKFEVEVDAESYSVIKEISKEYNHEDRDIVNYIMRSALKDYVRGYEEMKNGYLEMGSLNLEISHAFAVSENEAFNLID